MNPDNTYYKLHNLGKCNYSMHPLLLWNMGLIIELLKELNEGRYVKKISMPVVLMITNYCLLAFSVYKNPWTNAVIKLQNYN